MHIEATNPAEFSLFTAILVFVCYFVIDILYTQYIYFVTAKKPYLASFTSTGLYLLMAIGVINYTSNHWYLIPLTLGSWLGTFVVVSYHQEKK